MTTYTPSMADVKALREATLAGMMDCKKALIETNGDMEAAKDWLRAKGLSAAAKKAERAANAGLAYSYLRPDGQVGSLVEVNCETDFVSANDNFQSFVRDLAELIANQAPAGLDEPVSSNVPGESLLNLNWKGNPQENVGQALQNLIATLGENMVIKRYARFDLADTPGVIDSYIHMGGKVGVLVEFVVSDPGALNHDEFAEFRKDIAMHVAAASPDYVHAGEIDEPTLDRERKIATEKTREEGKPEHVIPNIVEGRVKKWISDVVLLAQSYVKDPDKNVDQYIQECSKKFGGKVEVRRFARFALGN